MKNTPAIIKRTAEKVIIIVDKPDGYNQVVVFNEAREEYSTISLQALELFEEFLINGERQWINPSDGVVKMFRTDQGLVKLTREFSDSSVYIWERAVADRNTTVTCS